MKKEKKILEKLALGKKVTVSLGVQRMLTRKYEAASKGLYHGRFDTEDAAKLAIDQWNNYLDKHKQEYESEKDMICVFKNKKREEKRLEKVASGKGKAEFKNKKLEEKRLEKVASGKWKAEGVAKRRRKITNTTCVQRLSTSQTVGPEGQEEVA